MLNVHDLIVFVAVADAGGITAAARRLQMPKSSVARQLTRLEDRVGALLFTRTTRAITLTDEGRTFLPFARRIADDCETAETILRRHGQRPSGLLTVSAPVTFGRVLLVPHLPAFRRRFPHVRVRLELSSQRVTTVGDDVDLAIRLGPLVDATKGARELGRVDYGLFAAASTRWAELVKAPTDLERAELVALRPPFVAGQLELRNGALSQSVRVVPVLEVNDADAALRLCLSGGGIAALPRFLVGDAVSRHDLVEVLPAWRPAGAIVHALYGVKRAPNVRVTSFLDHLAQTVTVELERSAHVITPPAGRRVVAPRARSASRPGR